MGKQTTTTTLKCFLRAKEECGDDCFLQTFIIEKNGVMMREKAAQE